MGTTTLFRVSYKMEGYGLAAMPLEKGEYRHEAASFGEY